VVVVIHCKANISDHISFIYICVATYSPTWFIISLLAYYVSSRSEFRLVISVTISAWKRCSIRLYLQLCVLFSFSLSCRPYGSSFSGLSIVSSVFSNVYRHNTLQGKYFRSYPSYVLVATVSPTLFIISLLSS